MTTSERNIFVDQENQAPEGVARGVLAPKRGKMTMLESRPVLGEISQNTSSRLNQPARLAKHNQQATFAIYCDDAGGKENQPLKPVLARPVLEPKAAPGLGLRAAAPAAAAPVRAAVPVFGARTSPVLGVRAAPVLLEGRAAAARSALVHKENILPAHLPKVPNKRASGVEGLRAQQSFALQVNPPTLLLAHESMNVSLAGEEVETAVDSPMIVEAEERQQQQQWRVPPIYHHHLTDIFTEPEYFQDIYRYLKESELKNMPKWNYMTKQTDITHTMRSILVDWLVEVGEEYKLQSETLFLAVSYIDRFLSYMAVQRSKLQLVGAACMFIAAKYEEIYPPDVAEFVYITDDTYNKRQVLRMEHLVLKVLEFDLSVPTIHVFVNKMCQMIPTEEKVRSLALYLSEMSLVDGENFLRYTPSQVAGAAVALSRHTLGQEAWPALLASQAGYQVEELKEALVALHSTFSLAESSAQQAVRDKYRSSKYQSVSELSAPSLE